MKTKRLVQQGGWVILATVVHVKGKEKTLDTIPIVSFSDVFPEDLPGIPNSQVIDFGIELKLGPRPISKNPSHIAPVE